MHITLEIPDVLFNQVNTLQNPQQFLQKLLINSLESTLEQPTEVLKEKRPIGLLKGKWELPESFFEPLPVEILDLFEGKV